MKLTTTLEDVQYAASICIKCGCCAYGDWPENHELCSIFYADPCFSNCAGGIMATVTALAENKLEFDQPIADLVYTCAGCRVCDSRCSIIKYHPPQVEMIDMIRLLRNEAVKRGFIPKGVTQKLADQAAAGSAAVSAELALDDSIHKEDAETVIFIDQNQTEAQKGILAATASLLKKIGSPVAVCNEIGFNEAIRYDYGLWENLDSQMQENWNRMNLSQAKKIVFTDPHTQEFVAKRYPENLAGCSSINTQHISQVIAEAFKNGKLTSKKSDKVSVSYHDPCYLGRGLDVYDAPREALKALPNVELVEMTRNRKSAYCCGARVTGNYYSDHAKNVATERMKEFSETGADLLITACSYCKQNLQKVLPADKKDMVMDITEFIDSRV
jgi:Fe-S oxidoreductase